MVLAMGLSPRTHRLRKIVLGYRLQEVATPLGWQVQARVDEGYLRMARWFTLFQASWGPAQICSLEHAAQAEVGGQVPGNIWGGHRALSMNCLRFTAGYDDTLLVWASKARRYPDSPQIWMSSAGVQRPMPAWTAFSVQLRLLLQLLACEPVDSIPLPALIAQLTASTKQLRAQHLLALRALDNCNSWSQLPSLIAEEQKLQDKCELEEWTTACLEIAEKHRAQCEAH